MEWIHIRQRLRPNRYAFMIKEGDLGAAKSAVSLNTVLWGGTYNPIIPLEPEEERRGLLRAFDPDDLVNLTGGALDAELQDMYQHRIVSSDRLTVRGDRDRKRYLRLGFDILPILSEIFEQEIRFSSGTSRAAIVSTQAAEGWPEYVAFTFGTFGELPEVDVDYKRFFTEMLRPQEIVFDPARIPDKLGEVISPIQVTGRGLRLFGGSASFPSHVIYIADHRGWNDLIEFWNIRATGRTVLFVPTAGYRDWERMIKAVAESGRYPVNPHVQNEADLQKGPSVTDEIFNEVCDWVKTLGLDRLGRRNWRPRFGVSIQHYVGDIHVAETEAKTGEEISLLQDSVMTPVKFISPDYLDEERVRKGEYSWAVVISMTGGAWHNDFVFAFPRERVIDGVLQRAFLGRRGHVRLGRDGVVIQNDDLRDILHMRPVRTVDVFYELFRQFGLEAEPSLPGRYAEQIIKKMGSLHLDCRIFKLRGVRAILDQLGSGSILTKGKMYEIVMSRTPDEYGQNWRPELYEDIILQRGQSHKLNFSDIFNLLLASQVIRPGFTMRCKNCFGEDWYHVSEFDEQYTCRFCFTKQRVNFGSHQEWHYKADGLFRIPDSALGSVAVILSLWRLEHLVGISEGRYLTSVNLRQVREGRMCEIDYAYLVVDAFRTSYNLVLGQATRFGDFTGEDTRKMSELSVMFNRKPYLAFATLKDGFSDREKLLLRNLVEEGHNVIALTREELDPYDLYERFDGAPHKYAVSLSELSDNTIQLNLQTGVL